MGKQNSVERSIRELEFSSENIKTVKQSIKTTKRTIKTTKTVVNTSGRAAYKTAVFSVKVLAKTIRVTGAVVSHVVATLMNPVVILIIAIVIVILMCGMLLIILLGGGANAASNVKAQTGAVGLIDVPAQYQDGLEFFRIAVTNKRNGFNGLIDGLYYDYANLPKCDLTYMVRVMPGTQTIYSTSFATDGQKNTLQAAWQMSLTAPEAVAIAYVYLEKIENAANGTDGGIYEVTFTQATFDNIVDLCAGYTDTVYNGQRCPDHNCTRQAEYIENPAYATAVEAANTAAAAYNDWAGIAVAIYQNSLLNGPAKNMQWTSFVQPQIDDWVDTYGKTPTYTNHGQDYLAVLGEEYEAAVATMNATPAYTERITYTCSLAHHLHSIGLAFYSANDVMNALGFTDADKQWVELTELGFTQNPDIP